MLKSTMRRVVRFFRDYPRMVSYSDAFSLTSVQLYVCTVEDEEHRLLPGICFELPRDIPLRRAVALDQGKAIELIRFLHNLETVKLPAAICFPRHDQDIEWKVSKFRAKWHGGGGLVGYLHANWLADHTNPAKVIIAKYSARNLRRRLAEIYDLPQESRTTP